MRKTCLDMVHKLARQDERVFFVGSDLGFETLDEFAREFPERFIVEGICEANSIGLAAGLALEGAIPYVNTIATFIVRRALEQIVVDACMHKLPLRLIGNGGGVVYAPLGSTHLAIEDISLMRALPRMTIVCPCDAEEMERFMSLTLDWPDPIYIRLGKGFDPVVSKAENGFEIGKAIHYRSGKDALLVTTGVTLQEAIGAADLLQKQGISVGILHMHTVKPFDTEQFLALAGPVPVIVSVEENTIIGGLGSAVAELLAETDFATPKRFRRVGLADAFPDTYGTQKQIMDRCGISPEGIAATVQSLLK